jgi:hypothetical protein
MSQHNNLGQDKQTAEKLEQECNINFASCIRSLIYLRITRTDKIYAVNKLAKFTKCPRKKHFEALIHLLHYLKDNTFLGAYFYKNFQKLMSESITSTFIFCLL